MRPSGSGGRGRAGTAGPLWCVIVALAGCASTPGGPPEAAPVRSGTALAEQAGAVFTSEQASRGEQLFTTVCAACHGPTEFSGPIFALTWMAEPVGHFFEHISTAMPEDRPGSLAPEEYAAVVAYLLHLNGRPAGDRELPAEAEALGSVRW